MKRQWSSSVPLAFRVFGLLVVAVGGAPLAQAQTSNYLFRYNTSLSSLFLKDMTFTSEQPLELSSCTVNEKINGPLACVVNCDGQSVCLLSVSGPSGATVADVMELASEEPLTSESSTPSLAGSATPGFGSLVARNASEGSITNREKAEAYSAVKP